jgi:hypothetical protein
MIWAATTEPDGAPNVPSRAAGCCWTTVASFSPTSTADTYENLRHDPRVAIG